MVPSETYRGQTTAGRTSGTADAHLGALIEEIDLTNDGSGLISDIHFRQIIALIEALDRSDFDSLELDAGGFRLTLCKRTDSVPLRLTELRSATPAPLQTSQVPAAARPAQHIEKQAREKRS